VIDVPQPATSLGGVESLVQQRVKSDPKQDPLLVRLSVGVEEVTVSLSATFWCCVGLKVDIYIRTSDSVPTWGRMSRPSSDASNAICS